MNRKKIVFVLLMTGLGSGMPSPAQTTVQENSSLVLMRKAWTHASEYGAIQKPVISPNYPDVFAGLVPIEALHKEGFRVLPGTTSDENEVRALIKAGADGVITDRPDVLKRIVADELSVANDAEMKARLERFDIQGHRGARGLRPENTLPAYEQALDLGITTIELDTGVTSDKVSSVWHDQFLNPRSCRHVNGSSYEKESQVYFFDVRMMDIQKDFICDKTYFSREQKNDRSLSPVAVAFSKQEGMPDAYSPVSLDQVFRFVRFYEEYYRSGQRRKHPEADTRIASAQRIRFDIETKLIPDFLQKDFGRPESLYRTMNHTAAPLEFVEAILRAIRSNKMEKRCEIESFDFTTLRLVEEMVPEIPTYYLTGNRLLFPQP